MHSIKGLFCVILPILCLILISDSSWAGPLSLDAKSIAGHCIVQQQEIASGCRAFGRMKPTFVARGDDDDDDSDRDDDDDDEDVTMPPKVDVTIATPEVGSLFNQSPIVVTGTISVRARNEDDDDDDDDGDDDDDDERRARNPRLTVEVNGITARVRRGAWSATVPLEEGNNLITAVGMNRAGALGTASIQVTLDTQAPTVTIDSPPDGLVTDQPSITVTGMINDIVVGTVNGDQARVTVNGIEAAVANRSYLAAGVPLAPGPNTITAIGEDQVGNVGSDEITVIFEEFTGESRITLVSGNNQGSSVGSQLPDPLVAALVDGQGNPVPGEFIIFKVTQNNGTLSDGDRFDVRSVAVTTDAQGEATAEWVLGTRAGAGNNMVKATAVGFAGAALYTATALPSAADKINVDAGNNQTGVVDEPLPSPFVAVVTDVGHNRLGGVPVTFTVVEGGGHFDLAPSVTIETDSDGRALASLTLGLDEGFDNNVVEATFPANAGFPATFVASGKIAGDPAATRVSGVVLDNTDVPIPGVTLRIEGTELTAQSNEQGQFLLEPAPVGHVVLVADGSTAELPGAWPSLEYELVTVAGQDNTIGTPIYLLPLDTANQLCVDETSGGTLTLPQVPGFSLTVAPGSATFPDGSKEGCVSVTTVHADKVPMVPNFGQQPRFIVTIQPAGVLFDPPAPITLPNTDGLAPGEVTELYSFDHDLGQFVSIGTGTVSEDGTVIASDPGVGIIKGGWHCGGNPQTTGGAQNASVTVSSTKVTLAVGQSANVTATGSPLPTGNPAYTWEDGKDSNGNIIATASTNNSQTHPNEATITGVTPGIAKVKVTYRCDSGATATAEVEVTVYEVTIEIPTGDPVTAGSADNEFTYKGAVGKAGIPVMAKIAPPSAEAVVADMIKWTLDSFPAGSVLSWDNPWPNEPTAGRGKSTNANLDGYPPANDQFGLRTVRMQVIDSGGNVLATETTKIEFFFSRDTVADGRTAPNWFFYWNQTAAGDSDAEFMDLPANVAGRAPAGKLWSTYDGPRDTIWIDPLVTGNNIRRDGSGEMITGIDFFANIILHENRHVEQIHDQNTLPFFDSITGQLRDAAAAGWSFNVPFGHTFWNHFTDTNGNNLFDPGEPDLDIDRDDLGNTFEPSDSDRLQCFSGFTSDVECQADLAMTSPEDTFLDVDWGNPGKQHDTASAFD